MADPMPFSQPVPRGGPQQALCPTHQHPAIGTCSRCGTFVCSWCEAVGGLCPACLARGASDTPFFAVSLLKLTVLSLCTFGLYELYWMYQNWKREKARTGEDLSPGWRTVFSNLFVFSLFRRIRKLMVERQLNPAFSADGAAGAFFLLSLANRLPGALWLIGLASFLPLLSVQAGVNRLNAQLAPNADPNRRFTGANIAVTILGGGLFLLALIGSFAPDADAE